MGLPVGRARYGRSGKVYGEEGVGLWMARATSEADPPVEQADLVHFAPYGSPAR